MPTTRMAHMSGGWLRGLVAATALWSGCALALDPGAPAVAGFCDGGKAPDCRTLFAVGAPTPGDSSKFLPALAFADGRLPAMSDGAGKPPAAGMRTIAARGGVQNVAAENWLHKPDQAPAEPGLWVLLLAGFLGICAVARPRIFTS